MCKFVIKTFPLWSIIVSSSYNLMALSLERYMGIVYPMFHLTTFFKSKIILLAGAAWCPGPMLKPVS